MKKYLCTDESIDYERLLGIAHELYALECEEKGLKYDTNNTTKYNANIIAHPSNGAFAIEISDANIAGLSKSTLDLLPEIFVNKLVSIETMSLNGWELLSE